MPDEGRNGGRSIAGIASGNDDTDSGLIERARPWLHGEAGKRLNGLLYGVIRKDVCISS